MVEDGSFKAAFKSKSALEASDLVQLRKEVRPTQSRPLRPRGFAPAV